MAARENGVKVEEKKFVVVVNEKQFEQIINQGIAEKWVSLDELTKMLPSRHTDCWGIQFIVCKLEEFFGVKL